MTTRTIEVCVVGAGPAGAAAAARLGRAGHDVAVVERHTFPRPHVGESLSAGAWPVLEALGVAENVAEAAHVMPVSEARVRWRDEVAERVAVPHGMTVDRRTFDALLLDHARACGARVRAPGAARRPSRGADGLWDIPVADGALRAAFLVDATGRRRLLGGARTAVGARTLAVHARLPPASVMHRGEQTWIDAVATGWLWGAHLPDGGFRIMAFLDPEALRAAGRNPGRLLRQSLTASPLFAELSDTTPGTAQACDATAFASDTPIDATSAKVGEAAFAIDPLSSCGVQTAIQTGLAAAAATHTILTDGDAAAATAFYAEHQRHSVARHAATAAALYAEHTTHAEAPFWRARRAGALAQPTPSARAVGVADLLSLPVRLIASAVVKPTPCLVSDRVELRDALTHPSLDRPVAYLGGAALAPLLRKLDTTPSLAAAIRQWEHAVAGGQAEAVAAWLADRGLLEPVSNGGGGLRRFP
jgi:flavin-dependent dehydrogenase